MRCGAEIGLGRSFYDYLQHPIALRNGADAGRFPARTSAPAKAPARESAWPRKERGTAGCGEGIVDWCRPAVRHSAGSPTVKVLQPGWSLVFPPPRINPVFVVDAHQVLAILDPSGSAHWGSVRGEANRPRTFSHHRRTSDAPFAEQERRVGRFRALGFHRPFLAVKNERRDEVGVKGADFRCAHWFWR